MKKGETLAKAMISKRMERNMSMSAASKEIGVDFVTLWKIESKGYTNLRYDTINKVAKFLEISEKEVRELL